MSFVSSKRTRWCYLAATLIILAVEVLIALYVHDCFVRPYFGDVLAVVFVYCLARAVLKRVPRLLALYVFLIAAMVEVSQLLGLATMLGVDRGPLGVVLGGVFDWADLAMYMIGCAAMFAIQWFEDGRRNGRQAV